MKKEIIAALLASGFTPEELYDQGILASAAAPTASDSSEADPALAAAPTASDSSEADPAPAAAPAADPAPAAETTSKAAAAPTDQGDTVLAAIMGLRNDIVKAIQQNNLTGAERAGGENKQMTVEDAITGLSKGV